MSQWGKEEEGPEEPLQDPQEEEGLQEEDLQPEGWQINQLLQRRTLRQWAKIPLPSMEKGAKPTRL